MTGFKRVALSDGKGLIYRCKRMAKLVKLTRKFSTTNRPVLILGEPGTGKELFARLVHRSSDRAKQKHVSFNAGGLSTELARSELFGHAKAAFTGAGKAKPGLFHQADGGSLFLDEIGELPLDLQPLLLRVLQEGELWRVGGANVEKVDVRIITATNRAVEELRNPAHFRADLLSRLAFHQIRVPQLRQRGEDVLGIADAYLKSIRPKATLSRDAQAALLMHDWPGNVRELQTVLENAMVETRRQRLEATDLAPHISGWVPVGVTLNMARQLRVLDRLFEVEKGLGRAEITAELDLPKGSSARVFRSLLKVGLIEELKDRFVFNRGIRAGLANEKFEEDRMDSLFKGRLEFLRRSMGEAGSTQTAVRQSILEYALKAIRQGHLD